MKRKRGLWLLGSVFLILILAGSLVEDAAGADAKTIELSFASYIPPFHWGHSQLFEPWAKAVQKATNGKVKVTIYPAGSLLKPRETYEGVKRGAADIGIGFAAFNPGRFPLCEAAGLPLGAPTAKLTGHAFWKLYKNFPALNKEFSDVKVIVITTSTPAKLLTRKPVRSMKDLKGMKIRVPGKWDAKTITKLGGTPILMPTSQIYMSLERGVIEGAVAPYDTLVSFKLKELVTDVTDVNLGSVVMYWIMNLEKWKSFPADIQKQIDSVSGDNLIDQACEVFDKNVELGKEAGVKKGIAIHKLSSAEKPKWTAVFKAVQDEWSQSMEDKGLPGKKFLQELRQLLQ